MVNSDVQVTVVNVRSSLFGSAAANKQDLRGYYGMGHVYEMLEMPHYALYYYKQAHRLRYI